METTFILKHEELNSNFLQTETAQQYMERLTRCLADIQAPKNVIAFSENELDQIILEKL